MRSEFGLFHACLLKFPGSLKVESKGSQLMARQFVHILRRSVYSKEVLWKRSTDVSLLCAVSPIRQEHGVCRWHRLRCVVCHSIWNTFAAVVAVRIVDVLADLVSVSVHLAQSILDSPDVTHVAWATSRAAVIPTASGTVCRCC